MKHRKAARSGGLSLLFNKGERPDITAIHDFVSQEAGFAISHDPFGPQGEAQQIVPLRSSDNKNCWLELLASGQTFDISGLSGGSARPTPACAYRFDLPDNIGAGVIEAVALHPGPHLADGERMLPVVKVMMGLAAELCGLDRLVAVAWHPARSWIGPNYFTSVTRNWLEGGVFPSLGLVGLDVSADGGMQSEGMDFFVGQEVRIEPELAEDRAVATNIARRLIDHLVEKGPLTEVQQMAGPEGKALRVEPSANQRFVRVWGG